MISIWVVPTSTLTPIGPALGRALADRGIPSDVKVTPFGEFDRQLLDPSSLYRIAKPDVTILVPDAHGLLGQVLDAPIAAASTLRSSSLEHAIVRVRAGLDAASRHSPRVLIANITWPATSALGFLEVVPQLSLAEFVAEYNRRLAELISSYANAAVVDFNSLVHEHGYAQLYDDRMWAHARMRLSRVGLDALAKLLARRLAAQRRKPRKCVVVDLDNTLWGGVLGEDGVDGIRVGGEGVGMAFAAFQSELLELRARGVLLAVASKNDPQDALRAIDEHPGMVLRSQHFATTRIGWGPKSDSLREIAAELDFDPGALVFVDDSAHERAAVRSELSDVAVVDLPADPADYVRALRSCEALDLVDLTDEDRRRAEMVTEDRERSRLRSNSTNMESFLASLDQTAVVAPLTDATAARAAQLCQRTNQFNLTLRRHDATALRSLTTEGAVALLLRACDRLGDSGVVAFALARPKPDTTDVWELDTFVMSCRVIARGYESALLGELISEVRQRGGARLWGRHVGGPRNSVCSEFLPLHGFRRLDEGEWNELDLRRPVFTRPAYVQVSRRESL